MVNKIVRRNIFKHKFVLLGIFILFTFSLTFISMGFSNNNFLRKNWDQYKSIVNSEDFMLKTNPMGVATGSYDDAYTSSIENKYNIELLGVNSFDYEFSKKENGVNNDKKLIVNKYNPEGKIDKTIILKGVFPSSGNEVLLSKSYAEANKILVGDSVNIEGTSFKVVGVGYIGGYPISGMNPASSGVGLIPGNTFDSIVKDKALPVDFSYVGKYNNKKTDAEQVQFGKDIEKEKLNLPAINAYGKPVINSKGEVQSKEYEAFPVALVGSMDTAQSLLDNDLSSTRTMSITITVIFLIIGMALFIILYNSIIKHQIREIGILKAEGFREREIRWAYMKSVMLILFIAILAGIVLGYLFVNNIINVSYIKVYDVPFNLYKINFINMYKPDLIINLCMLLIVSSTTYFFSIRKNTKAKTINLLKNITREKPPALNIAKITSGLPFKLKYKINILIRNFSKILLLVFGVFVSSFLMLFGVVMISSITGIVSGVFTNQYKMDYTASFSVGETGNSGNYDQFKMAGNDYKITSFKYLKTPAKSDPINEVSYIDITGFETKDNNLLTPRDEYGKIIPKEDYKNGIVISKSLENKYGLSIGDSIIIKDESSKLTYTYKISNIFDYQFKDIAYTDRTSYLNTMGLGQYYYNQQIGLGDSRNELKALDPKVKIAWISDIKKQIDTSMARMIAMVGIMSSVALAMSLIVLMIITTMVIKDNKKTISIMKVLGYRNKEIRNMIIGPFKWVVIGVYLVSIPIVLNLLNLILAKAFSDSSVKFNAIADPKLLGIVLIAIFLMYLIASKIAINKIRKTNLSESLKSED